ncbi:MAG: hypothetical protein U1F77_17240 [Kiritimatiellia bacterium]
MVRKFHIEGTTAFRNWGVLLLLFGLWHARDGWMPSTSVRKEHPEVPESRYTILFNKDHYYDYNRITAILSLTASGVCLIINRFVK